EQPRRAGLRPVEPYRLVGLVDLRPLQTGRLAPPPTRVPQELDQVSDGLGEPAADGHELVRVEEDPARVVDADGREVGDRGQEAPAPGEAQRALQPRQLQVDGAGRPAVREAGRLVPLDRVDRYVPDPGLRSQEPLDLAEVV